ncbi:MAG: hypothetical protein R3300_16730 [Candidatus Promineifilaceae bacterium]|nr:hypothetical protein [Candidatus Promineifilaceae bacterium]
MKATAFLAGLLLLAVALSACADGPFGGPDACDQDSALFVDEFDGEQECGWVLYQGSGGSVQIQDGALILESGQPGQIWWTNAGRQFDDVRIATTVRRVSGPEDNAFGIICRYQSKDNFYLFLISSDGFYAIGKYQSGSPQIEYLTGDGEFQFSEAINQGAASNDLIATCQGNELSMAVNGTQLATVTDPTFVTGDIGLGASTFQPGTAIIAFEQIRVDLP